MPRFEQELARGQASLATDADTNPAWHPGDARRLSRSTKATAVFIGAGLVTLAVAVLNFVGLLGGGTANQSGTVSAGQPFDAVLPTVKPGQPCASAERVTGASELAKETHVPVWVPDAPAAPRGGQTGWWLCGEIPALTYRSVTVYYEPGWSDVDAQAKWDDWLAEVGEGASVETILGRPALVLSPTETTPRGEVLLIVDDTLIKVLGDGTVPGPDLADVVRSIDADHPVEP